MSNAAQPEDDYRSWPLFWFARLTNALEAANLAEAADAQERLEELGLRVEPIAPWTTKNVREVACG